MKLNPILFYVSCLAVAVTGCSSNGEKLAKASEAYAECSLARSSKCATTLNDGTQLTAKPATLFATDDSVRVESVVQHAGDCVDFGNAVETSKNTTVSINNIIVKQYGEERNKGVKYACSNEPAPYYLALTVSKNK